MLPASIVHFACHGHHNSQNLSALILEDGELKVSRIMQQSMPNASPVHASWQWENQNCPTKRFISVRPCFSQISTRLLQLCGTFVLTYLFRSISDIDGPKVADVFNEDPFKANDSTTIGDFRPKQHEHFIVPLPNCVAKVFPLHVGCLPFIWMNFMNRFHPPFRYCTRPGVI